MKRILLVALPNFSQYPERVQPVGLGYLAAVAQAPNREIHLLDLNVHPSPQRALEDHLRNQSYDVVGFSFFNTPPALGFPARIVRKFSKSARKFHSGCLLVGGPTFSLFARQTIAGIAELDLGISGDGEPGLLAVLDGLEPALVPGAVYRASDGEVKENPLTFFPMEDLPEVKDLPGLDLADYGIIGIQGKRGCAHSCHFCSGPHIRGRGPRLRPVENVMSEIDLYLQKGMQRFMFTDPVFNEPLEQCKEFLRSIQNNKFSLRWWGLVRPEWMDREFVQLAESTGCYMLDISVDYGSEAGLKRIKTGKTLDHANRARDLIHNNSNISTLSYFLFGYPGIPLKEEWESFRFVSDLYLNSTPRAQVFLSPLRTYPYSPIARKLGSRADSLAFRILHTFTDIHLLLFFHFSLFHLLKSMKARLPGIKQFFRKGSWLKKEEPGMVDKTRQPVQPAGSKPAQQMPDQK